MHLLGMRRVCGAGESMTSVHFSWQPAVKQLLDAIRTTSHRISRRQQLRNL